MLRANQLKGLIYEAVGTGKGDTFDFEGGRIKIMDPIEEDGVTAIKLKITADTYTAERMETMLNKLNFKFDGEESPSNPDIVFHDESPGSLGITDKFGVVVSRSGVDFFDI
jgi:hypothetical protein